jgi:hypothetical protein
MKQISSVTITFDDGSGWSGSWAMFKTVVTIAITQAINEKGLDAGLDIMPAMLAGGVSSAVADEPKGVKIPPGGSASFELGAPSASRATAEPIADPQPAPHPDPPPHVLQDQEMEGAHLGQAGPGTSRAPSEIKGVRAEAVVLDDPAQPPGPNPGTVPEP